MEKITQFTESIPGEVQLACAGVGALYLGCKALSYFRFILSVFVLSGTNVWHAIFPSPFERPGTNLRRL